MANDYTEIVVILDRSGSMMTARLDHEGGLNSFVRDQQQLAGHVRFTLIQFDGQNACEVVYDGVPIAEVGDCALIPRGSTPLYEAIGRGIAHVEARLSAQKRYPDQVICMVITDGQNTDHHPDWTLQRAQAAIKELEQPPHHWTFLFLGANIDSFAEGEQIGFAPANSMNFANNAAGVGAMYASTSANLCTARSLLGKGASRVQLDDAFTYTAEQRDAAMGTGDAWSLGQPNLDLSVNLTDQENPTV